MTNAHFNRQALLSLNERLFRDGDYSAVDDLLSDDFVWREHGLPHAPEPGREGVFEFAYELQIAFPDWTWQLEPTLAARGLILQRWTLHGSHDGPLWGYAATHRTVTINGLHLARVRQGLICDLWQHWNVNGLLQQLGLVPATHHAVEQFC